MNKLIFLLFLSSTASSFALSQENSQSDTMAKCTTLAFMLKLDQDAELFGNAYKNLKSIKEYDSEFYHQMTFMEGMVTGWAAAKKIDNSEASKNFYYSMCKGDTYSYAQDLSKIN